MVHSNNATLEVVFLMMCLCVCLLEELHAIYTHIREENIKVYGFLTIEGVFTVFVILFLSERSQTADCLVLMKRKNPAIAA